MYDLSSDLGETLKVAAENGALVARLTKLMQKSIDRGRSTSGAPQTNGAEISLDADGSAAKPKKNRAQSSD